MVQKQEPQRDKKQEKQEAAFESAKQALVQMLSNRQDVDTAFVEREIEGLRRLVVGKSYKEILTTCSRTERALVKHQTRTSERLVNYMEETVRIAIRRHTQITRAIIQAEEIVAQLDIDVEKLKLRRDGVWDGGPGIAAPPLPGDADAIMRPVPRDLLTEPEVPEEVTQLIADPVQTLIDRLYPIQDPSGEGEGGKQALD